MIIEPSEHSENPKIQRPQDNWILLNFFYFYTNLKHIEEFSDRSLTGRGQHISPSADMKNLAVAKVSFCVFRNWERMCVNLMLAPQLNLWGVSECFKNEHPPLFLPSLSFLLPFRLPVPKGHHCLPIIQGSCCQGQGRTLFRPRELFSKFFIFSPFLVLFKILNFLMILTQAFWYSLPLTMKLMSLRAVSSPAPESLFDRPGAFRGQFYFLPCFLGVFSKSGRGRN